MKPCDEKEASKMEAYLRFFAEYFDSKNKSRQPARGGRKIVAEFSFQSLLGPRRTQK